MVELEEIIKKNYIRVFASRNGQMKDKSLKCSKNIILKFLFYRKLS